MESNLNLKAIVIGATGAVGRELVDFLLNNENYSKVTISKNNGKWEMWNPVNPIDNLVDSWNDVPEHCLRQRFVSKWRLSAL